MNEISEASVNKHNVWMRGLYMLVMALAFYVCMTVLSVVTFVQFLIMLLNGTPNAQLISFGRGMGNYLRQIVLFLTFATEAMPFPFAEWPGDD